MRKSVAQLCARGRIGTGAVQALAGVAVALSIAGPAERARADDPIKIAVFDFELLDTSAAAGIIPPDKSDLTFLAESTEEAKSLLSDTGRYEVIDTSAASQRNLANCGRCEGPLAQKLGAEQAMIGVVGRVNRTEYTVQIRIIDAATKEIVSSGSTGLRMGANYSWPRGVKWLMEKQILAEGPER
jgi:uncharacterized protein DUF2380